MTNFKQHILAQDNVAGASCANGAVAVMVFKSTGNLVIWRGVGKVMTWQYRDELKMLVDRAAAKLGYAPQRGRNGAYKRIMPV